jgi:uncharacterized protein (DUF697 family)
LLVLMFVVCWKLIEVCGPFLGIVICGMLAAGLGWFLGWLDSRRWK